MFMIVETVSEKDRSIDLKEVKLLRVEHLYKNGMSIANACKMIGISVHTYYKWRANPQTDGRDKIGSAVISVKAEKQAARAIDPRSAAMQDGILTTSRI